MTSRVRELKERAQAEIDRGHIPRCQYALAVHGEVVVEESLGGAPAGSRYTIFSATKPIVASLVWQLIGEQRLDPRAPVSTWWPEFAKNGKQAVTLEHVLLHTAGFPYAELDLARAGDRSFRVSEMESWTLEWEPGGRFAYHLLSAHWVLAELITRVTGQDHRTALRERVLDPLGLDRLELGVPVERQQAILPLQVLGTPPTVEEIAAVLGIRLADFPQGAIIDLTSFNEPEVRALGVPGGGAVSDAASLALFYQALLHNPNDLWDSDVLHSATTDVRNWLPGLGTPNAMRTIGLEVAGKGVGVETRIGWGATSPETFGHGGAAGQVAWADPRIGLSFAFLTDGADQVPERELRRCAAVSELAVRCVTG